MRSQEMSTDNNKETHVHWHVSFPGYVQPEPLIEVEIKLGDDYLEIIYSNNLSIQWFILTLPSTSECQEFIDEKTRKLGNKNQCTIYNYTTKLLFVTCRLPTTTHGVGFQIPKSHSAYSRVKERLFNSLAEYIALKE